MGITNEGDHLFASPASLSRLSLPEIDCVEARSPGSGQPAAEDEIEEDAALKLHQSLEKVRLVTRFSTKGARRGLGGGGGGCGRGSPELKTIEEAGPGVGGDSPGEGRRSKVEERMERFRIDEYKMRVGESLADALSLRDQVLELDSDLSREEEAIAEDHKALKVRLSLGVCACNCGRNGDVKRARRFGGRGRDRDVGEGSPGELTRARKRTRAHTLSLTQKTRRDDVRCRRRRMPLRPGDVQQDIVSRRAAPQALAPPQRGREDPTQSEKKGRQLVKMLQKKLSPVYVYYLACASSHSPRTRKAARVQRSPQTAPL